MNYLEAPRITGLLVDNSKRALALAARNKRKHGSSITLALALAL